MTEPEQQPVGPAEQGVIRLFYPDGGDADGWQWTSYDQMSPDGTNVLGSLAFLCCPVCGAAVASPPDSAPVHLRWDLNHIAHHREIARIEDRLA